MVQTVINENKRLGRADNVNALKSMRIYQYLTNPLDISIQLLVWITILVFAPQFQLIIMIWQIMFVAAKTNVEIDHKNKRKVK